MTMLNENQISVDQKVKQFKDFILFCKQQYGLKSLPKFKWFTHSNVGHEQPTFGSFQNEDQTISVGINNRHPLDIMRTIAHELWHYKQLLNQELGNNSGETGSPQENDANAQAGIIMRNWNKKHPEMFAQSPVEKLNESVDNSVPDEVLDFINTLSSDDVGKERFGDYVVHFEGFSDVCQADAEERTQLSPNDPRHLSCYEDIYKEVLNDFINREGGVEPVSAGLAGDELYPVYYAIFHKPALTEAELNRISQYHNDGGSLEGYVVDTDQPQLENYLTGQGASIDLINAIRDKYHRIGIIRNMWVDEEIRGGGIGTDLLGQAIGDAFEFGADAILLVADMAEDNSQLGKSLEQWYKGWGFNTIGSAGGDPVMILDRELNESWSKKYKKSIDCSHPKGFSQRAHCAGRRARQAGQKTKSKSINEARGAFLTYVKNKFPRMPDYVAYELIYKNSKFDPNDVKGVWTKYYGSYAWKLVNNFDINEKIWDRETLHRIRDRLARPGDDDTFPKDKERFAQQRKMIQQRGISTEPIIVEESREDPGKYTLLEGWHRTIESLRAYPQGYTCPAYVGSPTVATEKIRAKAPDSFWQKLKKKIIGENFADGKGPGKPGDSQRHGIPKGATIAQLEKAAKAPGRKGQLARWQLNMRRGRAKNESEDFFHGSQFGDDAGNLWDVEKVLDFAKSNPKYFRKDFPLSKIKHDLSWWQGNRKRMMAADTSYPLLVLQNPDGHLSVADGLNRMKKAVDVEGKKTIDVYLVPKEDIEPLKLEKLNESLTEGITVYHGSSAGGITQFKSFSHFGSEKAAADRIKFLIKQKKISKDTPIAVYKIDLNIHKPAMIKDAAVQHDSTQYAFALKDAKIFTQEEMMSITTRKALMPGGWDQAAYDKTELESLDILKDMLKAKGYDGLIYKNKYEDKGSLSYVILDPSQVRITEKKQVLAKDLVEPAKQLNELQNPNIKDTLVSIASNPNVIALLGKEEKVNNQTQRTFLVGVNSDLQGIQREKAVASLRDKLVGYNRTTFKVETMSSARARGLAKAEGYHIFYLKTSSQPDQGTKTEYVILRNIMPDGDLKVSKHFQERVGERVLDIDWLIGNIKKAVNKYTAKIKNLSDNAFIVQDEYAGVAVIKNVRPDGSNIYTVSTTHSGKIKKGADQLVLWVGRPQITEKSVNEIMTAPEQNFDKNHVINLMKQASNTDQHINGYQVYVIYNAKELMVILYDQLNQQVCACAGFESQQHIRAELWTARNATTFDPYKGKNLIAKIYKFCKEYLSMTIQSDMWQTTGAKIIWTKGLQKLGLNPKIYDSYTHKTINIDPKEVYNNTRYQWVLESSNIYRNQLSENSILMPYDNFYLNKTNKLTDINFKFRFTIPILKENKLLDKPTLNVGELAEKYHTSLLAVKQQLARGIKVEMEHTSKVRVAKEIALDHLGEDLYYYEKLAKIEKKK